MPRALALAVAVLAALVLASTAGAAAPRYILVSGSGVPEPALLRDWSENLELLTALLAARHADRATIHGLGARPRLRLGLFWGWPENPRSTSPAQANQTGWLVRNPITSRAKSTSRSGNMVSEKRHPCSQLIL